MRLSDIPAAALTERIAAGLGLQTGPFRFLVQSSEAGVARGLSQLYADFEVGPFDLHDFHVSIRRPAGLRRWIRPQVEFAMDGFSPFIPLPADHAFAQLEWGMNWCIAAHAHHYLMLHAAVLEKNGQAVILPGDPGAGKSTLTAALVLSGWRLLSDEITLIDRDDGQIVPLARPVSLKNASIDIIRSFSQAASIGETALDTHKGSVAHLRPMPDSVLRMDEKAQPRHIVFPRWKSQALLTRHPQDKASAFIHLASHAFNYNLLGPLAFRLTKNTLDTCTCQRIWYSQLDDALAFFSELVA
jgi:HprK-related kinase A